MGLIGRSHIRFGPPIGADDDDKVARVMFSQRSARPDQPEVEGMPYVDPRDTFILHRHSGRAPELKTQSYYKRSWKSGKAASVIPVNRAVAVFKTAPAPAASAVPSWRWPLPCPARVARWLEVLPAGYFPAGCQLSP
jgi:hypothetical protein